MNGGRLSCLVAAACLACGARTPLSSESPSGADAGASADASAAVTLTIPLGTYVDCTSATVTTRPHFVGGTGRDGTITLTQEGDSVVAALDFPRYASGRVAFAPTTGRSAALRASQAFEVQTANASFSVVTVTATTGALSLVGSTLFLSTRGRAGTDDVSTFFHCRAPVGVTPTSVVTRASPPGRVTAGVYGSCIAASSTEGPAHAGVSGGRGSLTVTEVGGTLRLAWTDSVISELGCRGLDFGADPLTAALTPGQTCEIYQPCGPPPTLGSSPFPLTATLTDLQGSVMVNGNALFIDLLGDAGARACGVHDLSITCAGP
jgi:hypothetical protein